MAGGVQSLMQLFFEGTAYCKEEKLRKGRQTLVVIVKIHDQGLSCTRIERSAHSGFHVSSSQEDFHVGCWPLEQVKYSSCSLGGCWILFGGKGG